MISSNMSPLQASRYVLAANRSAALLFLSQHAAGTDTFKIRDKGDATLLQEIHIFFTTVPSN
jgi:hypothetical protein